MNDEVRCTSCGTTKDRAEFFTDKRWNCPRQPCKECRREYHREYHRSDAGKAARRRERHDRREQYRERQNAQRRGNTARETAKAQARRKANPERHAARLASQAAIKRGDMKRQPCVVCGIEPTDAHHPDYSKPLEVEWLCRLHHAEAHGVATYASQAGGESDDGR